MTQATPTIGHRTQAGYTLLMVVFMVASMMIAAAAVAPNLLTQGRREKEAETVWRGEQYERAIGLYYRKFGKYPTKIEDLTKQTNGLRFLRQAYKDPMNADDGSWRFIYVNPANGQLIGSLRQTSLLQTALSPQGILGLSSLTGGIPVLQSPGATTNQQTGTGPPGQQTPTTTNTATTGNPLESQPQPLTGAVLGGNIIGVGSKIKKPSLRIYQGGDTYQTWEFIWNPMGQSALPGQTPANPNQNPTAAPNGAPPNGTDPNAPGVPPQPPPAGSIPPPAAQ